jgi:hypothetical protein
MSKVSDKNLTSAVPPDVVQRKLKRAAFEYAMEGFRNGLLTGFLCSVIFIRFSSYLPSTIKNLNIIQTMRKHTTKRNNYLLSGTLGLAVIGSFIGGVVGGKNTLSLLPVSSLLIIH